MLKYILSVAVIVVSLRIDVQALSQEEKSAIQEKIMPHVLKCSKEFEVSEESMKDLKQKKSADGIDTCFFACIFKESGLMNEKGMFDIEKALAESSAVLKDEDDIKNATEVINDCASVNSEDVNDGHAGCDRAKLLLVCFDKNKEKFSFGQP